MEAKEKFCFLSLGKNLLVQRAWLYITNYMSFEIANALHTQMVDSVYSLKNTTTFDICRQEKSIKKEIAKEGDVIFHVPLAVTNVSQHHYAELFQQLGSPTISIGQKNQNFCSILTEVYKSKIDLLISKEVVAYCPEWTIRVNPELFTSSYSIPIYLYIINHIQSKQAVDVNLSDLSQILSAGKYEFFSDFEKRILKPVKDDFDKGLLEKLNPFTFDYEINRKNYFGKKSEISLTLKLLNQQESRESQEEYNEIQCKMEATTKKYEKYTQLLETNKNLILAGAPGTGKTFMAKEIAKEFITNTIRRYKYFNDEYFEAVFDCIVLNKILDTQIMMVQFHPSYDYTDFVEGLRPVMNVDGTIGFKRSDGLFKNFCKNHYNRFVTRKKTYNSAENTNSFLRYMGDLYCECYDAAVKDIECGFVFWQDFTEHIPEPIISRYRNMSIEYKQYEDEDNCIVDGETSWVDYPNFSYDVFQRAIQSIDGVLSGQFPSKEDIKKNLIEVWNEPINMSNQNPEIKWKGRNFRFNAESADPSCPIYNIDAITDFYYTLFYWIIDYARYHYERQYLPSVIIIDEINRGEINKIFGELFFSIDPGYRGEYDENGNDNKVQTQYQNLIPKEGDDNFDPQNADIFRKGFYVPKNVYIIGTMNDIDRSIESLDFATRRRFAFVEVTAEESYQNMIAESNDYDESEKVEIKKRMSALNKAILMPELKLGEAYQIGAAYFRKYLSYKHLGMEQAFKMLWNYHLKGLLFEYLRGNQNAKAYLDELEKAYNKKHETNDETDKDNG